MEEKTEAVRREILKYIIDRFGNKPKKILIKEVKERGAYKNYASDEEVYELVKKFADFHNMPFGYVEPKQEPSAELIHFDPIPETVIEDDFDDFLSELKKEHDKLSKKMLALNKIIELYKN